QQYREFESGIHHQDCCINEHRIEPGPADRPKESVPVLMVSDLVVGVDGETGQVMCDPEEQNEYHVDDQVRCARRNVRTGREGSSSGGEEWRNPMVLAGLDAEIVDYALERPGPAWSLDKSRRISIRRRRGVLRRTLSMILGFFLDVH